MKYKLDLHLFEEKHEFKVPYFLAIYDSKDQIKGVFENYEELAVYLQKPLEKVLKQVKLKLHGKQKGITFGKEKLKVFAYELNG